MTRHMHEPDNRKKEAVMAYVSIPKDLDQVKNKVAFGLTLRQIICFGAGASIGVPVYFMTRNTIGTTNASLCMMVILLPAFMMAIFEKDGLPLEQVLMNHIRNKYLKPEVRMYKSKTNRRENSRRRTAENKKSGNGRHRTAVNNQLQSGNKKHIENIARKRSGANIRVPGSDIPKNSPVKGTLIRDPYEDDGVSENNRVSISFARNDTVTGEGLTRQPITDEIILREIRKNLGYEYGQDTPKVREKEKSKVTPRYQYRGMPSFLANPTVMSFEDMVGMEEEDTESEAKLDREDDFLPEDISYAVEENDIEYDSSPLTASNDSMSMVPVEDYLDRLLNSVG